MVFLQNVEQVRVVCRHRHMVGRPCLQLAVDLGPRQRRILHLTGLGVLQERRERHILVVPRARTLLEYLPQQNEAGEDEHPEDNCLDR